MEKNSLLHKIVIALIFMVIAGFVFYLFYFNSKNEEFDPSVYRTKIENEPIENYEIKEKPEGRFVVNNQAGFMFLIPTGWNVEMVDGSDGHREVKLLSSDAVITQEGFLPSRGCIIGANIIRFTPPFPDQASRPRDVKKKIIGDSPLLERGQEIVTVDNRLALKTFTKREHGGITFIELPIDNTIYHFGFTYSLTDEDECLKSFDQVINSVSID